MENPIKMDDLGVPLFLETPTFSNLHLLPCKPRIQLPLPSTLPTAPPHRPYVPWIFFGGVIFVYGFYHDKSLKNSPFGKYTLLEINIRPPGGSGKIIDSQVPLKGGILLMEQIPNNHLGCIKTL